MNRSFYLGLPQFITYDESTRLNIGAENKFDLVPHTLYGLLDDLIPGSDFCNNLLVEFDKLSDESYGEFVFYGRKNHLVRFAPRLWHKLALVVRNSTLILDPNLQMSWGEVRSIFDNAVISVAGCSVGNSAIHSIVSDIRPNKIKIADSKDYHITNANRVRLTYEDFGRTKSLVTAEQIHALDPFMQIEVFTDGIHSQNIDDFVRGSSVIIEETDDLRMKIAIREKAREFGVPILMVTDIGSAVQLDVRRFDIKKELPLASCTQSDKDLYDALLRCEKDPNRKNFFDFVSAIIGGNDVYLPEYRQIIRREVEPLFAGVPQLGSTVAVAGGIVAETAARLLLGYKLPERLFVHKYIGKSFTEGELI